MDAVADGEFAAGSIKSWIGLLNIRQRNFVNSVYSSVDEAAGRELNRLCDEEGVIPTCKQGCFNCCGQHILTSVVEAQALAHYIKHEFSRDEIEDLRIRTQQWHEWDKTRQGRHHATHIDEKSTFSAYHYCPILVEGKCRAYPMRPLICRTHFVCSDPRACRPSCDPESIKDDPVALASVIVATNPFSLRIRDLIEKAGFDFYGSIMLLPHWLAIEMNWDFAISPEFG
jgi:Fe-S-cluster containining protein